MEDLKYAQIPELVDNSPSASPNFKGFVRHSHDQSVLTNLAVKYGIKGFRNPSQGGNYLKKPYLRRKGEYLPSPYQYSEKPDEESNYQTIFYNKRNSPKIRLILIKLHAKLPVKIKKIIYNLIK